MRKQTMANERINELAGDLEQNILPLIGNKEKKNELKKLEKARTWVLKQWNY